MLKIGSLTAVLSVGILALVAGCSPSNPSGAASVSVQSDATQPLGNNAGSAENTGSQPISLTQPVNKALSPDNPDSVTDKKIEEYVNKLAAQGFSKEKQGVWIEANKVLLANHQGTVPLPAASVTKAATTLAVLQTFGPEHQFVTLIGATGPIENGVLKGDLVIQGGEDPFFVWEEAIALGNTLNQMGIKRVTGNLVIAGNFYMNFEPKPQTSGTFLKQGLNSQDWPAEAEDQYLTLPQGTPRPEVAIDGSVQVISSPPESFKPLVRHLSFPVAELLKKMNMYSNNLMAEMLADSAGGAKAVAQKAAEAAGVPAEEIQLINGSGLGEENRISPRAAVGMFQAIERYLQPYQMTIADVFAIAGKDLGVLEARKIPAYTVLKTGTLNRVSSLAGAMPTQKLGSVWVAIMNGGENQDEFRAQQEVLLNRLLIDWGAVQSPPAELTPNPSKTSKTSSNEIVK
ncbi:D-alanyl-D-alanine carboxypeptidase [Microcoleus sp. FACHB-68]|nr:D-alanyl-D-alanine carboxypeptidase [Microcoleus sp. FACHB-68]MBD1937672.1 D-alanyl-D-alanine carboxypeptidase [Microcoleus sp. FACHB-68]